MSEVLVEIHSFIFLQKSVTYVENVVSKFGMVLIQFYVLYRSHIFCIF